MLGGWDKGDLGFRGGAWGLPFRFSTLLSSLLVFSLLFSLLSSLHCKALQRTHKRSGFDGHKRPDFDGHKRPRARGVTLTSHHTGGASARNKTTKLCSDFVLGVVSTSHEQLKNIQRIVEINRVFIHIYTHTLEV